jgi:divalent metal cation (Fe/Co/Zn/Cd) transporter
LRLRDLLKRTGTHEQRASDHDHVRNQSHGPGHSHGLVDPSIKRSQAGLRAVGISLGVLGATALAQGAIFAFRNSVALLADLIHNVGDALTAVPLGIAFLLRNERAERIAGLFVVLAILISALVALYQSIVRLIDPQPLTHLWVLAAAGALGFIGNEIAAYIRLRAGRRLNSPALIADGYHARTDGLVSLGVILSAIVVSIGLSSSAPNALTEAADRGRDETPRPDRVAAPS